MPSSPSQSSAHRAWPGCTSGDQLPAVNILLTQEQIQEPLLGLLGIGRIGKRAQPAFLPGALLPLNFYPLCLMQHSQVSPVFKAQVWGYFTGGRSLFCTRRKSDTEDGCPWATDGPCLDCKREHKTGSWWRGQH